MGTDCLLYPAKGWSWEYCEMPSMSACTCVHLSHCFTSSFISHSFMKMSSPNLQRMLMAGKICLKKICPHFKKHAHHRRLFENHHMI